MQICCEKEFRSGAEEPSDTFRKNTYMLPSQKLEEGRQKEKKMGNMSYDLNF